jgi:hypothetical protein
LLEKRDRALCVTRLPGENAKRISGKWSRLDRVGFLQEWTRALRLLRVDQSRAGQAISCF